MKTLDEIVVTAAGEVLDKSDMKEVVSALRPLFQQAIDQSALQWQDGPPTTNGKWLCVFPGGKTLSRVYRVTGNALFFGEKYDILSSFGLSEIVRHFGPIPKPPEKPSPMPLSRRFECEVNGEKGCGVQFASGVVVVECDGVVYRHMDYDAKSITKWLDTE